MAAPSVAPAAAQPAPAVWFFEETFASPRSEALAGAFGAAALDDFAAVVTNPAGLSSAPKFLEGGWALAGGATASVPGARLVQMTRGTSLTGALFRIGCNATLAGFYENPFAGRIENTASAVGESREMIVRGGGAAFAYRFHPRATAGVTFAASSISATFERPFAPGGPPSSVALEDGDLRETEWTIGFHSELTHRLRAGATYATGRRFSAQAGSAAVDGGGTLALLAPAILKGGAAYDLFIGHTRAWATFALQGDWARYGDLADAAALRIGTEVSLPLGCFTGCGVLLQARAGFQHGAPGSLVYVGPEPERVETAAVNHWALGGSVAFNARLPFRVDAAARFGGGQTSWSFGFAGRYGLSFRDGGRR